MKKDQDTNLPYLESKAFLAIQKKLLFLIYLTKFQKVFLRENITT